MLMPVTRTWTSMTLKTTRQTAAHTAVRNSVSFGLRPKITRRSHEPEPELLTGV